jgi:hypothetical protein
MKLATRGFGAASLSLALLVSVPGAAGAAEMSSDLLHETLRQQSTAERSACTGIRRTLTAGNNPAVVVRTAVELGYNSCQVLQCALGAKSGEDKAELCRQVIRGAVAAGVPADVISRCSADACDPADVAVLLAGSLGETNYCYIGTRPLSAPDPQAPQQPIIDRSQQQPQYSPYRFPAAP